MGSSTVSYVALTEDVVTPVALVGVMVRRTTTISSSSGNCNSRVICVCWNLDRCFMTVILRLACKADGWWDASVGSY